MYIKEKYSSALAKIITNFDQVYLDTCSLMEEGFPEFMDYLEGSRDYWQEKIEIIVLSSVIHELNNHAGNKENANLAIDSKRALKIIKRASGLLGRKLITVNDGDGEFADKEITAEVIKNRTEKRILVITQDRKLATDLRNINFLNSQKGKETKIYRIKSDGTIEPTPSEIIIRLPRKPIRKETKKTIKLEQNKQAQETQKETKTAIEVSANKNGKTTKEEPVGDKQQNKTFFALSKTVFDGAVKTASHFSIIVRDSSVAYLPNIHGECDITNDSLLKLIDSAKKTKNGNLTFAIDNLKWKAEKFNSGYKVTLSIENHSKSPANPAQNSKISKNNKKTDSQKKKIDNEAKTKKETAKPKKSTSETKPSQNSDTLSEAKKLEARLRANYTNPNYPADKKIKDIEDYQKIIKKIPVAKRDGIKYTTAELNKMKAELSIKKD